MYSNNKNWYRPNYSILHTFVIKSPKKFIKIFWFLKQCDNENCNKKQQSDTNAFPKE